jgi:hypothetical protein
MGSAVRAILRNSLYTGRVRWNVGGYVRNPDTARRVRRPRPQVEWVEHCDEGVRIIIDELFQRAEEKSYSLDQRCSHEKRWSAEVSTVRPPPLLHLQCALHLGEGYAAEGSSG